MDIPEPTIGDVRVRSDGTTRHTKVEALTENGWLPLNGVCELEWSIKARSLAEAKISIFVRDIDLIAKAEEIVFNLGEAHVTYSSGDSHEPIDYTPVASMTAAQRGVLSEDIRELKDVMNRLLNAVRQGNDMQARGVRNIQRA